MALGLAKARRPTASAEAKRECFGAIKGSVAFMLMIWIILASFLIMCLVMAAVTRHLWILFGGLAGVFLAEGLRILAENGCTSVAIALWVTSGFSFILALFFFRKSYRLAKQEDAINKEQDERDKERYRRESMKWEEPHPQ